ncbi:MAG: hypothetical protein IPP74_01445 [Alphaproteobacteria bacterium]|nr:hypothetical protein [Alphaproteobacteria bacterium]
MDDQFWGQIVAATIGGAIAAGTGWFIDWRRESRKFDKARALLITGICDDLQHSLVLFDKVSDEYQKTRIIYFATLNELKESRHVYQNNKDWITVFDDGDLRKQIFKYYLQSNDAISMLEFNQRRKYELENKHNELVTKIKSENKTMSDEDAGRQALSYMVKENNEYMDLNNVRLPESVAKLREFKATAENIIVKLKNMQ